MAALFIARFSTETLQKSIEFSRTAAVQLTGNTGSMYFCGTKRNAEPIGSRPTGKSLTQKSEDVLLAL